jgi:chromosome partitioning protein
MIIISVAIQKGGSGKTTTAINLAAALRDKQQRVLLIDLDPQANLTQALGIPDEVEPNLYTLFQQEVMGKEVRLASILIEKCGMKVAPSSLELANSELELVSVYGRERILSNMLQPLANDFDYVIIDCPPAIGMLTVNALAASQWVLMPLQAEFLPLKGVRSFMRAFERIRRQLNPTLQPLGFLLTKFDLRKTMTHSILFQLTAEFGDKVLSSRIHTNIALVKSQEAGLDIFSYDAKSRGANDYLKLAEEVLKRVLK